MNEFPPLRNIPIGFSLIICCGGLQAIPELSKGGLAVLFRTPLRIISSRSSSEPESSGRMSFGSGSAGGDLISCENQEERR